MGLNQNMFVGLSWIDPMIIFLIIEFMKGFGILYWIYVYMKIIYSEVSAPSRCISMCRSSAGVSLLIMGLVHVLIS